MAFHCVNNNKTITRHVWNMGLVNGDDSNLNLGDGNIEPPHTGVSSVEVINFNNVAIVDKKRYV